MSSGERTPTPVTRLTDPFFDYDYPYEYDSAYHRQLLFKADRALKGLIKRGLVEVAGTAINHSGGDTHHMSGRYCPKGYTRICTTYRLTDPGREVAARVAAETRAELAAAEAANPKLKEIAARLRGLVDSVSPD
jgi:hypothetical protein